MSKLASVLGLLVIAALAGALLYAGWHMLQTGERDACAACGRTLHSHAKVVGQVDGEQKSFCCPACALADHREAQDPTCSVLPRCSTSRIGEWSRWN